MGGSKTYSISKVKGGGGKISGSPGNSTLVLGAVQSGVQNEIIAQSLGAMISYGSQLNTLVYALKLVKLAYEMYCAGEKAYNETGDENEAIKAAAGVVIKKAIEKVKGEGIRLAVSYALNQQGIKMEDTTKSIIVDSVSNAVEESLKWLKKQ